MRARIVVLSACETGLGKFVSGEGIIGLTRAFMYAGVDWVVVSLWVVADESTSLLMQKFYEKMISSEVDSEVALKQGKLELMKMKSSRGVSYSHPFFWAPFIIIRRGKPAEGIRRLHPCSLYGNDNFRSLFYLDQGSALPPAAKISLMSDF